MYQATLVPAYGRNYKRATEVLHAWHQYKDFRIVALANGPASCYTSKRDWKGQRVKIRFDDLKQFIIVEG
jgi:hypothetical protein